MMNYNLGLFYFALADQRDREDNLARAVRAFEDGLLVCTFDRRPRDHVRMQYTLGRAYLEMAEIRDSRVNLERAVSALEKASLRSENAETDVFYRSVSESLEDARRKRIGAPE